MTNIDRREFVRSGSLATGAIAGTIGSVPKALGQAVAAQSSAVASTNAADKQPNIVFILTDNLGYGEIGCYGGGITRGATPRIDSLANDATRLLNMNMETQCTPSRSSLMTGRWVIRSGTHSVPFGGVADGLTQWEVTIGKALSDAGYATGGHRPYDRKVGYARRIIPERRWGAWEVVARYSQLDLNDRSVSGGILHKDFWH